MAEKNQIMLVFLTVIVCIGSTTAQICAPMFSPCSASRPCCNNIGFPTTCFVTARGSHCFSKPLVDAYRARLGTATTTTSAPATQCTPLFTSCSVFQPCCQTDSQPVECAITPSGLRCQPRRTIEALQVLPTTTTSAPTISTSTLPPTTLTTPPATTTSTLTTTAAPTSATTSSTTQSTTSSTTTALPTVAAAPSNAVLLCSSSSDCPPERPTCMPVPTTPVRICA